MTNERLSNALRALSMDAVQQANSGHPGMPMGMADIANVLWRDVLKHSPQNPKWWNRDRFVLSNGHGSMLLYSLLYLTGYDLSLEDLKQFRQLHSKTAGHPEVGHAPGIETTTGPLGQGIANAVGMALAETLLANQYNRDGFDIVDHFTYVFLGDGCLMEGVSHEACSLAGTLKLGKLIAFWDDNGISIDGEVINWFTDDTPRRFEAYGWQVIADVDGHDVNDISRAIEVGRGNLSQPTLICCKTTIGYGSPNKSGKAASHGAALGEDEVKQTKQALDWPHGAFDIPEDIKAAWDATEKGASLEREWESLFAAYQKTYPALAAEFTARMQGELPVDFANLSRDVIEKMLNGTGSVASRKASLMILNELAPQLPALIGGSADLTGSNCTKWAEATMITPSKVSGNYLEYGVREFGMFAIMNGLSLHGGFIPFGGTFLVFSDYARNALRMAALMKIRSLFVLTHDSIGLGEDGPTHQPVEHLASLRLIPNLSLWRPCDTVETGVAWTQALLQKEGPSALVLSRQTLDFQPRDAEMIANIEKGGYVLKSVDEATLTLLATGSEVALAMNAAKLLEAEGHNVRVVSMPCVEYFEQQEANYKERVLAPKIPIIVIEAGRAEGWYKVVANHVKSKILSIDTFGQSAPAEQIFDYFNFTPSYIADMGRILIEEVNHAIDTA